VLIGLRVHSGGTRGNVGLHDAGCHRLAKLGRLNGDWLGTDQLGDSACRGTVGTPFHPLEVCRAVDRPLHKNPLRRPRHRVQQHHALLRELFLQKRLLRGVEFLRRFIGVGQEGQAVCTKKLPFVLKVHQQDLASLCLAALHSPFDFRSLEERRVGVHCHPEPSLGGLLDFGRELVQ